LAQLAILENRTPQIVWVGVITRATAFFVLFIVGCDDGPPPRAAVSSVSCESAFEGELAFSCCARRLGQSYDPYSACRAVAELRRENPALIGRAASVLAQACAPPYGDGELCSYYLEIQETLHGPMPTLTTLQAALGPRCDGGDILACSTLLARIKDPAQWHAVAVPACERGIAADFYKVAPDEACLTIAQEELRGAWSPQGGHAILPPLRKLLSDRCTKEDPGYSRSCATLEQLATNDAEKKKMHAATLRAAAKDCGKGLEWSCKYLEANDVKIDPKALASQLIEACKTGSENACVAALDKAKGTPEEASTLAVVCSSSRDRWRSGAACDRLVEVSPTAANLELACVAGSIVACRTFACSADASKTLARLCPNPAKSPSFACFVRTARFPDTVPNPERILAQDKQFAENRGAGVADFLRNVRAASAQAALYVEKRARELEEIRTECDARSAYTKYANDGGRSRDIFVPARAQCNGHEYAAHEAKMKRYPSETVEQARAMRDAGYLNALACH
jgi:hypothetical protein